MLTAGAAFLLSLATAAVLTPVIRRVAHRVGALDHARSSRKVHGRPVPRLGGVAIVTAFYAGVIALLFLDAEVRQLFADDPRQAVGILVGGSVIGALGVYDDLWGAGARAKFAVQFAVAGFAYALGYRIDELSNPFGGAIQLGWFGLPLTMLWIAGVVNAFNLIDGLDGLAGGLALISVGVVFVLSLGNGEPLMALVSAALAGAVLGFLRYNFNPASIFMGDTGSMFLGFILATCSIASHQKSTTAMAIAVPVVALGLPIADTLLAMLRRALRGAPMFRADRDHIHHRLLRLGLSHRQAVLAMYGASAVLGGAALALAASSDGQAVAILAALVLVAGLVLRRLGYLQLEKAREVMDQRRRNLERRSGIRGVGARLRAAAEVAEVWEPVKRAAEVLGARRVELEVMGGGRGGSRIRRRFEHGADRPGGALVTRHALLGARSDQGSLELVWKAGQATLDRDTEIAVEALCDHLRSALRRIEVAPHPRRRLGQAPDALEDAALGMAGPPQ